MGNDHAYESYWAAEACRHLKITRVMFEHALECPEMIENTDVDETD